jgi:hypothetical protein
MNAKEYLKSIGVPVDYPVHEVWAEYMESYHQAKSKEEAQERYEMAKSKMSRYVKGGEVKSVFDNVLRLAAFGKEGG